MPKGWGLNSNTFYYQEDDREDACFEIHEVSYTEEKDKTPKVHVRKIVLPKLIKDVQGEHHYNEDCNNQQRFHLAGNKEKWDEIKNNQKLEESGCDTELMEEAQDKGAKAPKAQNNQKVLPETIEKAQNTLKTEPEAQEMNP